MSVLVVRAYLELAILLTVGLGLAAGGLRLAARIAGRQPAHLWLRLAQTLLVAALALPPLARTFMRPDALYRAPVQVASGVTRAPTEPLPTGLSAARPAREMRRAPAPGERAFTAVALALLAGSALGLLHLLREGLRLRRLCRAAIPIRQSGRVRVSVSERAAVPFSAWTGRHVYVVLPEWFVLAPGHLRIALAHEFAHVRARDIGWAYVTGVLRALLPWHPAAHLWVRWLARLEELSCDERVLARRTFSARAYGECLLWAAKTAPATFRPPGFAVSMLDGSRTFLERRIEMLFDPPVSTRRSWMIVKGTAALAALGVTAVLAQGVIADHRLVAGEIQAIADDLARATGFKVTADETVVNEVNLIVSRAEARASFREGLARLSAYRPVGGEVLRHRGLPLELLAIPQAESRVQPLPEAMNRMRSAGIWQFIPATARHYGLRVDKTTDERLDPVRSAEAAALMLAELHEEFHDWRLAIAAYNAGPEKVRRAIAAHGTTDAVALAKAGGLSRYASSVLAAALIIHRPEILD